MYNNLPPADNFLNESLLILPSSFHVGKQLCCYQEIPNTAFCWNNHCFQNRPYNPGHTTLGNRLLDFHLTSFHLSIILSIYLLPWQHRARYGLIPWPHWNRARSQGDGWQLELTWLLLICWTDGSKVPFHAILIILWLCRYKRHDISDIMSASLVPRLPLVWNVNTGRA